MNMTVDEFIMAFVRFYNRFGLPSVLYSDNAKSFVSSISLLTNLIASDQFQQKFAKYNLKHKTIPTYSPWFGATWERLIKTIKQCLYKVFGRNTMLLSNFSTALSDIQLAINNRPLTYRDKDNDLEVVTPNHLISTGVSFPSLIISEEFIPGDIEEEDIRDNLLNSLEMRDIVISKFRNEWYDNYLLSLRDKHKNSYCSDDFRQGRSEYLKVGSVVIIKSPVKPRPFWTIGKIIQLLPGDDEYIRVAEVLKPDKSMITTSVTNLYPLELDCHNLEDDANEDNLIPEPALGNNFR